MSGRKPPHRRVAPRLDRLRLVIGFAQDGQISLHAAGESDLQRSSLWVHDEVWPEDDPVYGPYDAASHLILACAQDRPNTKERLFFSLNGGIGWVEEELPFPPK